MRRPWEVQPSNQEDQTSNQVCLQQLLCPNDQGVSQVLPYQRVCPPLCLGLAGLGLVATCLGTYLQGLLSFAGVAPSVASLGPGGGRLFLGICLRGVVQRACEVYGLHLGCFGLLSALGSAHPGGS
jgi:hypothetical protein